MLETVIMTAVIGILASMAIPKLERALDVSYVDYEIRCLHSLMHYNKSVSRLVSYYDFGFGKPVGYKATDIELLILHDSSNSSSDRYCVKKYNKAEYLKEYQIIERGFRFDLNNVPPSCRCNVEGDFAPSISGTIFLSKNNIRRSLVLHNYGRARIDRAW